MSRSRVLALFLCLFGVLQFVPGVGVSDAQAACTPAPGYGAGLEGSSITCTYRDQAWAAVNSENSYLNTHNPQRFYTITLSTSCGTGYYCYRFSGLSNGYGAPAYQARFPSASQCPAGTTWNDTSKTCFGAAQCLARNADLGSLQDSPRPSLTVSRCVAGCDFSMRSGYSTFLVPASGVTAYRGVMKYTGNACGAVTPTNPAGEVEDQKSAPVQECAPIAGSTVCVRGDGKFCLSSVRTGRQFCWRPGETGEKTDFDVLEVRNAGDTPTTPTTLPPAGDHFTANGSPVVAQITAGGVTITAVTQNYTTSSGASAGGAAPDQGTNSDGSSGPSPGGVGDSGSSGEDGGVTGGADCANQPQVTGDPLLANVILQTWGTRCAVESAKSVHSTGEIGVCSQPWSVDGPADDANVAKLKGIRATICGSDDDGNGIGDAYEGTAPTLGEGIAGTDAEGDATASQTFGPDVEADSANIDWGGWAGYTRTCPVLDPIEVGPGMSVVYSLIPECDIMQALGYVLLLLASLFSLKVMAGGIQ